MVISEYVKCKEQKKNGNLISDALAAAGKHLGDWNIAKRHTSYLSIVKHILYHDIRFIILYAAVLMCSMIFDKIQKL